MDYSQAGAYFVTICAFLRHCLFGSVESDRMDLSPIGEIVRSCWVDIPNHFPGVKADTFVVMPNHVHGILAIEERARRAVPLRDEGRFEAFRKAVPGTVPTIVRNYKAAVTKRVRDTTGNRAVQVWQSNYFERVLRNGEELANASRYIQENVAMWHLDKHNP
jgi:REP element-mobilizing transposase RayT